MGLGGLSGEWWFGLNGESLPKRETLPVFCLAGQAHPGGGSINGPGCVAHRISTAGDRQETPIDVGGKRAHVGMHGNSAAADVMMKRYRRVWQTSLALWMALLGWQAAQAQDASRRYAAILDQPTRLVQIPQRDLLDIAIYETSRRTLIADRHTPWQVVHGILAQRWDMKLRDQRTGQYISGIEWIFGGAFYDKQPLWEETPYGGQGHPFTKPYAFEGHPTQFLGYMCLANIPLDYEIQTPTKVITIRDVVQDAKMQVRTGREITWTLWALAHYEPSDAQWINARGEAWSIERLLKMQVDEPVTSGACGGCHGLFALAYARNLRSETGQPLTGVWIEADQKVKRYLEEARSLQNPDGSFSANHFLGPGQSTEFTKRISTSGHQLEWLMMALPQSRLNEEWVQRGITNVARDLIVNRNTEADCGPLFHALHSLVLYRQRTVPGYEEPKFNSHVKLAQRRHKGRVTLEDQPSRTLPPVARPTTTVRPASYEPLLPAADGQQEEAAVEPATEKNNDRAVEQAAEQE
jgi:hypothetical protein